MIDLIQGIASCDQGFVSCDQGIVSCDQALSCDHFAVSCHYVLYVPCDSSRVTFCHLGRKKNPLTLEHV